MLNQNNIYFCLSLLQQQIILQNELNKFCSLITIFDDFLEPLKITKDLSSINFNLDYIVAALTDAKINNECLIGELREYIKMLITLFLISSPKN
jgi:hypothetical protein